MKGHRSSHKGFHALAAVVFISLCFSYASLQAQTFVEDSLHSFIAAGVNQGNGRIVVLSLRTGAGVPFRPLQLFQSPQLNYFDKCFFTCQINGTAYFTNNGVIPLPPPPPQPQNAKLLDDGIVTYIKSAYSPASHGTDTIRTIWSNKNGVDIIQDVWCIPFTKSGVVVFSWRFVNNTGSPVNIACQYLNDIEIADQTDPDPLKSNDGPLMLTKYQYNGNSTQMPSNPLYPTLPWFYISYLHDLPHSPSFRNLGAMGYMDFGAPLNLIKPQSYANDDWYTTASWLWGISPTQAGKMNGGNVVGPDNAVLLSFPGVQVPPHKTGEAARTAYGTGEYETCEGEMFSIVFYPHHLIWHKDVPKPPGSYSPDSVHIEKYLVAVPPNSAANTKVTLTVSKHLTLSTDSSCKNNLGPTQTKPATGNGIFIPAGGVQYFDWWACPNPAYFCNGQVTDTLTFTAACSACNPAFIDQNPPVNIGEGGVSDCQLPIIIDCAETDINPPQYTDTVINNCDSVVIHVHDRQKNDKGLASATWKPTALSKTDTNKVKVLGPFPPIKPCYFDTLDHIFYIWKKPGTLDTTAGGSYDFTFTDCIGNVSYATISIPACVEASHPDSLPPVFTLLKKYGTYDPNYTCGTEFGNNRVDSFQVTDNRPHDSGIDTVIVIQGTDKNMTLSLEGFTKCAQIVFFKVSVVDSMKDGTICLRAYDCLKTPAPHYTDTCIYYCTIHDTLPPVVVITKDPAIAGIWHVCVYDDRPWDRLIDEIFITGLTGSASNVHLMNAPADTLRANTTGKDSVCFDLIANDTTQTSSFCIEAIDLAGNRTQKDLYCSNQTISPDTLCPMITFQPALTLNPTSVTVFVADTHTVNGVHYVWDSGIDKIWFTNNHGMLLPNNGQSITGNGKMIDSFVVRVRDTTSVDTIACVTINASDLAGNTCYQTYCYPYTPDVLCPVTQLQFNPADSSIVGVVTDSTESDRGLNLVTTGAPGPNDNLTPSNYTPNGVKVVQVSLKRPNTMMSSVGTLTAQDVWGALSLLPNTHLCTVNFAIWVQSFALHDLNPDQNTNISIPVNFVKNDSFAVNLKGITSISFTVHKNGATLADLNSVRFDSIGIANTEVEKLGWTHTSAVSGANNETIQVTLTMPPGGNPLDAPPLVNGNPDSLIVLKFHTNADISNRRVELTVDNVVFNNNLNTTYTASCCSGVNSTAIMPAPYGTIDSATIVITGECAPRLLTSSAKPNSVSLDPNNPNPFSHKTTFYYTVAVEGPVMLAIYDELGNEITRLVDEVQKQGVYTLTFDGSKFAGGHYIARIQANGTVKSRSIAIEK